MRHEKVARTNDKTNIIDNIINNRRYNKYTHKIITFIKFGYKQQQCDTQLVSLWDIQHLIYNWEHEKIIVYFGMTHKIVAFN